MKRKTFISRSILSLPTQFSGYIAGGMENILKYEEWNIKINYRVITQNLFLNLFWAYHIMGRFFFIEAPHMWSHNRRKENTFDQKQNIFSRINGTYVHIVFLFSLLKLAHSWSHNRRRKKSIRTEVEYLKPN